MINTVQLSDQVIICENSPDGFIPLSQLPLVILVGLTGSGKTTLIKSLTSENKCCYILPERREITDKIIIPWMQQEQGETGKITDRIKRFQYASQFRQHYHGGIVYLLSHCHVSKNLRDYRFIFDGLRDEEEINVAITNLPNASFVVLIASHIERLKRLLKRQDAFDQIAHQDRISKFIPDINLPESVFPKSEWGEFFNYIKDNRISNDDLAQKAAIVIEEARYYDHSKILNVQKEHHYEKSIMIDTTIYSSDEVANLVNIFIATS